MAAKPGTGDADPAREIAVFGVCKAWMAIRLA
jgi:hypothetical protein